ncbi:peptidoglycan-binding protein [Vibrio harveyi]|uniref:peptidoglycan-binding protein n=1 Tax=Vibrio harveyi TaxID=669 RepID=UPI003CF66E10
MYLGISEKAISRRINAALFDGDMTEKQTAGIERYFTAYFILRFKKIRIPLSYLAYTLATVYHETAFHMQPVEEYGKGAGHEYGIPDPITKKAYYGRGDVQVTWKYNYERLSKLVYDVKTFKKGVDLVNYPELLLEPLYSAQATIIGMATGLFTGKSYSDYLDQEVPDYVNARRIINGTDRAETIAGYAHDFERAIKLGFGAPLDRSTIKVGSKGVDVRELQINLGLNPDGIFGNNTKAKVIKFQEKYDLFTDGIVGKKTWKKIESVFYWEQQ